MNHKSIIIYLRKIFYIVIALHLSSAFAVSDLPCEQLTIYTYDSVVSKWGLAPKIKPEFEKLCNCQLNFVAVADSATMVNRLRMEGNKSSADLILGLDANLITEAKNTGLFAEHNVSLSNLSLPTKWDDNTFIPFNYGYFAFIYNKEKVLIPPRSFQELLDEDNNLTVIYQDPRTSPVGLGLVLWLKSIYGDKAVDAWQQLARKTVTVTKGWSEAYNMFLAGEADVVLSYTTSPAYHLIAEQDTKFTSAIFTEGHYMHIELAAKTKRGEKNKLADQFLTFMLSSQFQAAIATSNWMYPVIKVELPIEFIKLNLPSKVLSMPAEQINMRKYWVKEWQQALIN